MVTVLGNGYLEMMDSFGDELTIVDSARVSYGDEAGKTLTSKDKKLIAYLWNNKHWSPFRHVLVRWRIRAPEFVMRQLWKHIVGIECTSSGETKDSAWNEISGRYKQVMEYHTPSLWRSQHKSSKQASGPPIHEQKRATELYAKALETTKDIYNELLEIGVAREQARIILPLSQMTEVVWTASTQAIYNFIQLRDHPHAQEEIRQYAIQMKSIFVVAFPELGHIMWPDSE